MSIPLPVDFHNAEVATEGNTGLWYNKFCRTWDSENDEWTIDAQNKAGWIAQIGTSCGTTPQLIEHSFRIASLAQSLEGQLGVFSTDYRFVTGLGYEHPVENGMAWHHTLGTPYLPGSSVKGIVKAYAEAVLGENPDTKRIFGETVGSVIFLDAIPISKVPLKPDIMTPHYSTYYQGTAEDAPGDWNSPTPIPFLTVAAGAKFVFAVLPRTPKDKEDAERAFEWLTAALSDLGAGAKTAIGYGRFSSSERDTNALIEEIEKAKQKHIDEERRKEMSPLAAKFDAEANEGQWHSDKDRFTQDCFYADKWYAAIEETKDIGVLELMISLVDKHYPELLTNPAKTKGKKAKPVFNDKQREAAGKLNKLLDELSAN